MKNFKHQVFLLLGLGFLGGLSLLIADKPSAQTLSTSNQTITLSNNASCGSANGQTLTTAPYGTMLCSEGTSSTLSTTDTGWLWACQAANGSSASCSAKRYMQAGTASIVISGICGNADGKILTSMPATSELCSSGTASSILSSNAGWNWKCMGTNGIGQDCGAKRYSEAANLQTTESIRPSCGSANGKTLTAAPVGSEACSVGAISGMLFTDTGWSWKCIVSSSTSSAQCSAAKYSTTPATPIYQPGSAVDSEFGSVENSTTKTSNENVKIYDTAQTENTQTQGNPAALPINALDPLEKNVLPQESNTSEQNYMQAIVDKRASTPQPVPPILQDATRFQSPKQYGSVDEKMKVEAVGYVQRDLNKKIALAGKAEPDTMITIFIYSDDPVVITVKTDGEGNWHYELDKELADGQHEAYIAVMDEKGQVIKKSQPIAFIKTAEAATAIASERLENIENNKSPIQKSQQSFVLVAIVIMVICLAIALALIGVLTHKKHTDEGPY